MFVPTPADPSLDVFSISPRKLNVTNIKSGSMFQPCTTRVPQSDHIKEASFARYKHFLGHEIPSLADIPKKIDPRDVSSVEADHFFRYFCPISLPQPNQPFKPTSAKPSQFESFPSYGCELPNSTLHVTPKVFHEESLNPIIDHPLPKCSVCGRQLKYPFYSSIQHFLCPECLEEGGLPPYTSTFDFYQVKAPTNSDGSWTLEETNQMLTLFENLGDNWQEIAKEMKTRTPSECLIHFMRLPMYDPYYVTDPLSVPPGAIPENPHILPFMIAAQPIACLIEFIHVLDEDLGVAVATESHSVVDGVLQVANNSVPFSKIGEIIRKVLQITQDRAKALSDEKYNELLDCVRELQRCLNRNVNELFKLLSSNIKSHQMELGRAQ